MNEIEKLLKKYYNDANDPIKNWKEGEQWSNENDKLKIRKNALYTQFSLLDGIVNEIKSTSNRFQWSQKEKQYARQMIKCLDFSRRNTTKIIVSIIILTKLSFNSNRQLCNYDNILTKYDVSHDFVLKTSMRLHKDFTKLNMKSKELYTNETIAYDEKGRLFLSRHDKKNDDTINYGNDYVGKEYSDSENFDYSL